ALDEGVRRAAARHVHVLLLLTAAPFWAQGPGHPTPSEVATGAWEPKPTRYSGRFGDPLRPGHDLPRVVDYEVWNEENVPLDLAGPNPVQQYRALLNAGYGAIKSVSGNDQI